MTLGAAFYHKRIRPLPTANARSEYGKFLIDKECGFK
jgi:hypothetical protein